MYRTSPTNGEEGSAQRELALHAHASVAADFEAAWYGFVRERYLS
jgi:hypothetical protein